MVSIVQTGYLIICELDLKALHVAFIESADIYLRHRDHLLSELVKLRTGTCFDVKEKTIDFLSDPTLIYALRIGLDPLWRHRGRNGNTVFAHDETFDLFLEHGTFLAHLTFFSNILKLT